MCNYNILYRIVTYKRNNRDELQLNNISYTKKLDYCKSVTNVGPEDKLGSYLLQVDRNIGLLDVDQRLIFEHDIVKDVDSGIEYVVEFCQDKLSYVFRTDNPDDTLESLDITNKRWRVINNIYKENELVEVNVA